MCRRWPVASVTRDCLQTHGGLFIPVLRSLHPPRCAAVTQKTPQRYRAIEVGSKVLFVARRHIPTVPLRVIANWRLKEVVPNLYEKSECPMARSDHVVDRVFGEEARSRHLLSHAVPGIGNREAAS